jgi:hypothetical protein
MVLNSLLIDLDIVSVGVLIFGLLVISQFLLGMLQQLVLRLGRVDVG